MILTVSMDHYYRAYMNHSDLMDLMGERKYGIPQRLSLEFDVTNYCARTT